MALSSYSAICQSADTVYILFEESNQNLLRSVKVGKHDRNYPRDLMRTFYIANREDSYTYHPILPHYSNQKNDYFYANEAFLARRKILSQNWFLNVSEEEYAKLFNNKNTVIYLAEKSRFKDGYYTFIRVYFKPFVYE